MFFLRWMKKREWWRWIEARALKGNPIDIILKQIKSDGKEHEESYYALDEQSALAIRKKIRQLFSCLSIIAGFCDKNARSAVYDFNTYVSRHIDKPQITVLDGFLLEKFCTFANCIVVDFNKTPFSFTAEFRIGFDKFKASIRTTYKQLKNEVVKEWTR